MVNTITGGGVSIIACPYGIRYLGPYGYVIVQTVFAILTFLSLRLIVDIAEYRKRFYFFQLVEHSKYESFINIFIDIAVMLNCGCVIIVFFDSVIDVTQIILEKGNCNIFIAVCTYFILFLIIFLLCLLLDMRKIQITSSFAMLCWIIFLCYLFYNFIEMWNENILPLTHERSNDFLKGITATVLCWTSQFNTLAIYRQLKKSSEHRNQRRMNLVFLISVVIALCIYISLGMIAYYSFSVIQSNIINNLESDSLAISSTSIMIAQTFFAIALFLSTPLFFMELRNKTLHLKDCFCNLFEHNIVEDDAEDNECMNASDTIIGGRILREDECQIIKTESHAEYQSCFISNKDKNISVGMLVRMPFQCSLENERVVCEKEMEFKMDLGKVRVQPFLTFIIISFCVLVVIFSQIWYPNFVENLMNFIGGVSANSVAWMIPTSIAWVNQEKYRNIILSSIFFSIFILVFVGWLTSLFL